MNANVTKTNGVKLLAVVMVMAMVFAGVAVAMSDSETDAATIPTKIGGGLTPEEGKFVLQTYSTGEVIVTEDFVIPNGTTLVVAGAKFTVNEGVTITVQAGGQLVFLSGDITINGDITATGGNADDNTYGYIAAIVNNVIADPDSEPVQKPIALNGNITLERGAKMTADNGTVGNTDTSGKEGVDKYTIASATTGDIVLSNGSDINVTKRSSGVSIIENQNILLNQGATFSTNGHINNVTVAATANTTYYTAGAVSINTDAENPNYYKVTDKDNKTTDVKETSNLTFTVTSESTPALIQATTGTVTYQQITLRQYILNVDGTVDAGDELAFEKGGSFYTGTTYASVWQAGTSVYYVDNEDHTVATGDENKVILPMTSVTGNLVVTDYKGDYTSTDPSKTYNYNSAVAINGYVSVSGTITVQCGTDAETFGIVTIDGTTPGITERGGIIYVTGSVTMNAASIAGTDTSSSIYQGSIIVDGGSIIINDANVEELAAKLPYVSATMYTVENTSVDATTYLYDFDVAIAKAAEAKVTEVFVFASGYYALGYDCYQLNNAEEAIENGAVVIDADITVPAEMEITIAHGFVVAEGATLTLSEGVLVNLGYGGQDSYAKVFVAGKIVDNDETMAGFDDDTRFVYEVKKTAETETSIIATYTTLAIALSEANPGETIELNNATNPVMINDDVTIPADVTVVSADVVAGKIVMKIDEGAVLTIDGILDLGKGTIAIMKDTENNNVANGSIVNNNIIVASDESTGIIDTKEGATYTLNGAEFEGAIGEDYTNNKFFTSVAVAAENSANMEDSATITINGKNSIGDVTFTKGENADSLTVTFSAGSVTTAGTVTAVGAKIVIADYTTSTSETEFTGTVLSQVTAGTSAIALDKAAGVTFQVNSSDDGQTITTTAEVIGTSAADNSNGKVTVSQGTVAINDDDTYFKNLIVANGATLDVAKGAKVTTATVADVKEPANYPKDYVGYVADMSGLTVDGTVNIAGEVVFTYATINGTVNVAETGTFGVKATSISNADGVVAVNGTLAVAEKGAVGADKMFIAGTASGAVNVKTFAIAYPGSVIADAGINMDTAGEETTADVTNFYVNGNAVATLYAEAAFTITDIRDYIDVSGVNYTTGVEYYSDEAMRTAIDTSGSAKTVDYENIYISMDASEVTGKISAVQGMTIYIDGLALKNFEVEDGYALTVGDHYVTVQVTPGYSATPVVTFNGQTVTDGKITITGEMKEFTLLASGDVSVDTGATGGDGMGLTEILLVILVILIVVMAIMVALRLMRS